MMIVSGLIARANGCDFSTAYWHRLRGMLQYIASIMDAGGHVPNFGDADDAIIARLDPDAADVYRSLLRDRGGFVRFGGVQVQGERRPRDAGYR